MLNLELELLLFKTSQIKKTRRRFSLHGYGSSKNSKVSSCNLVIEGFEKRKEDLAGKRGKM
jgi:hypothetical protein